jgi:hypothetical protein
MADSEGTQRLVLPAPSGAGGFDPPLTRAQQRVFSLLHKRLPAEWRLYVRPALNGLHPEFVALDPQRGIVLIKVDDRPLGPEWQYRALDGGKHFTWCRYDGRRSRWMPLAADDPVAAVRSMEREALALYLPSLPDTTAWTAALTTVVVFTGPNGDGSVGADLIDATFEEYRRPHSGGRRRHQVLASLDMLSAEPWPGCDGGRSRYMNGSIARDMEHWLLPSRFEREKRKPLPTDARQREMIRRRLPREEGDIEHIARRRLRGPAGSGKSTVVAARAAELAARGNRVLVLGFNHTLIPALLDLSRRWSDGDALPAPTHEPQFLNLFTWCRRLVTARDPHRWGSHWDVPDGQDIPVDEMVPMVVDEIRKLPLEEHEVFDAVLVDEAQDFGLDAWRLIIEHAVRPGGEAMLVADHTQDIYERGAWTDDAMTGAGFSGRWAELEASYRLPENLREEVVRFMDEFIRDPSRLVPLAPPEAALQLDECDLRWVQLPREGLIARAGHEVDMLLKRSRGSDQSELPLAWSDVAIITGTRATGEAIVDHLRAQGIDVAHTFAGRRSKAGFSMGDPRPKVTTIHSFKGVEARSVLVTIEGNASPALVYAGLTRVRRGIGRAHLTVLCTQPEFAKYGSGWPDHHEE